MAWQLVYTSAAKLLEAGRTGFGTVARHRSVNGLLATSVERLSQFARLPGHDPKRVVYCHRIINVGGSDYHVLSCLRDAGSDYTGRTNHIAHHLVAESGEIERLIEAGTGITPGDVLRAMSWRSEWTESARYFDDTEEINLEALKSSKGEAWRSLSGNAEHARLPWADTAQRGCYFVTPSELDLLPLISESLDEEIAEAWQTTFTTNLEPNDDVADFKWIGLPVASPLRSMAEASARPIFDLTSPATLPSPPPARSAAPVDVVPPPAAATGVTSPAYSIPAPYLGPTRSVAALSRGNNLSQNINSREPQPPKDKEKKPLGWMYTAAVVFLLVLGLGGGFLFIDWQDTKKNALTALVEKGNQKAANDKKYAIKVADKFKGWKIPDFEREVLSWDAATREEHLKNLESLLKSIENLDFLEVRNSIDKSGEWSLKSREQYELFIKAAKAWSDAVENANKPLATEIESNIKKAKAETKNDKGQKAQLVMKILESLEEANKKWNNDQAAFKKMDEFRDENQILLRTPDTHKEKPDKLYTTAMSFLADVTLDAIEEKNLRAWKELVKSLPLSEAKENDKYSGFKPGIKEWLECDDTPEQLAQISLPAEKSPPWLRALVDEAKTRVNEAKRPDPNDGKAKHTISVSFINFDPKENNFPNAKKEISDAKIESKMWPETKLFVWPRKQKKGDKKQIAYLHSEREGTIHYFAEKVNGAAKDRFIFSDGNITQIPSVYKDDGCRLVGFYENKIFFDIFVIGLMETLPVFTEIIEYSCVPKEWQLPNDKMESDIPVKEYTLEINKDNSALAHQLASVLEEGNLFKTTDNTKVNNVKLKDGIITVGSNFISNIQTAITDMKTDASKETDLKTNRDNLKSAKPYTGTVILKIKKFAVPIIKLEFKDAK